MATSVEDHVRIAVQARGPMSLRSLAIELLQQAADVHTYDQGLDAARHVASIGRVAHYCLEYRDRRRELEDPAGRVVDAGPVGDCPSCQAAI